MTRALSELREQVANHAVNHADPGKLEILIDRATLLALIEFTLISEERMTTGWAQRIEAAYQRLISAGWDARK